MNYNTSFIQYKDRINADYTTLTFKRESLIAIHLSQLNQIFKLFFISFSSQTYTQRLQISANETCCLYMNDLDVLE